MTIRVVINRKYIYGTKQFCYDYIPKLISKNYKIQFVEIRLEYMELCKNMIIKHSSTGDRVDNQMKMKILRET